MPFNLAPSPRQQYVDASGNPYAGAKLFFYAAGTSTKQSTYTTSVGDVANSNPVILDAAGRTPYGVWLKSGLMYKEVLAPAGDTDPPTSPIFAEDNISGTNDISGTATQWATSGAAPTYLSTTQFTVVGDKSSTFQVNRRVRIQETAGTVYGYITASVVTGVTTVTVILDSGTLDSGISSVDVGVLTNLNGAVPHIDTNAIVAANATTSNIWAQGGYVTLSGAATVFTDFADAPQIGASTVLYCNAAHTFTNNANLIVDGAANFVAAIGDRVVVRALTTTIFSLHPVKLNGRAVVDDNLSQVYRVVTQLNVTSSTTKVNIPELTTNLSSGKIYEFTAKLYVQSVAAGGARVAIVGSAGNSSYIETTKFFISGSSVVESFTYATAGSTSTSGGVAVAQIEISGTLACNLSGTFYIQFAQSISDVVQSSVLVGSTLTVRNIT